MSGQPIAKSSGSLRIFSTSMCLKNWRNYVQALRDFIQSKAFHTLDA